MLKVFLAEDEFVIRNGIRNNINWEANGYEYVGDASDGELAWPKIQSLKPDIVITDIRMPFMDGLELSRLIRRELPQTEIIVLTGHEEFDYARQAVNLGVAKYLLKPINAKDLLKELEDLSGKIEEKRRDEKFRRQYQLDMQEKEQGDRREFFNALVRGTETVSNLLEQAEALSIDLSAVWYNIILFKARSVRHAPNEFSRSVVEIGEKMSSLQEEDPEHIMIFDRVLEGKAVLVRAESEEELKNAQERFISALTVFLQRFPNVRYFGGIGRRVMRLSEMSVSYERANHALAHLYLYSGSMFLDSEAMERTQAKGENADDLNLSDLRPQQVDRKRIREFLMQGEKDEAVYFVDEFFSDLSENVLKSAIFRNFIVLDAWFAVLEMFDEAYGRHGELGNLKEPGPEDMRNADTCKAYIVRLLTDALEIRENRAKNKYNETVREAVLYIQQHYMDAELSLNDLASRVNVSPNHLSTLFSQQTGKTFIRYLTDLRMEKAKVLLKTTSDKTSVVAMNVGYQDSHYFSYLFRKMVGMPPTQFRQGREKQDEIL